MFLILGRTFKEGLANFWRNGWLSVASSSVLVLALFILSALFAVTSVSSNLLKNIEGKVNISVYFKSDVSEESILNTKKELESYSEIRSVEYVSRDRALEEFKKNNAGEPVIVQSLAELGDNPLLASLVIKANNNGQYDTIARYVENAPFKDDVSRVNYGKNKEIISKLNDIVFQVKKAGAGLAILFSAISILIIFNTVRITIYTHRQEIEIMRLVGASNMYIRLPFIFEGILCGIIAAAFSMALLFAAVKFAAPYVSTAIPSENLVNFYLKNFTLLFSAQAGIGAGLGILSSLVAMRRYLKI